MNKLKLLLAPIAIASVMGAALTSDVVSAAPVATVTTSDNPASVKIQFNEEVKINNKTLAEIANAIPANDEDKFNFLLSVIELDSASMVALVRNSIDFSKVSITVPEANTLNVSFYTGALKAEAFEAADGGASGNRDGIYRIAFKLKNQNMLNVSNLPFAVPTNKMRIGFKAALKEDFSYDYNHAYVYTLKDKAALDQQKLIDQQGLDLIAEIKTAISDPNFDRAKYDALIAKLDTAVNAFIADDVTMRTILNNALNQISPVAPQVPAAQVPNAQVAAATRPSIKLPNAGYKSASVSLVALLTPIVLLAGYLIIKK